MAHKLSQPAKIHDVFHVSQLKKFQGVLPMAAHIPSWLQRQDEDETIQPEALLDMRVIKVSE